MENTNKFGEYVRSRRIDKGITLRKFAEAIGVSPTYVSGFEKGTLAPPTQDRILVIASILGEDYDELMSLASRWDDAIARDAQQRPELVALYRAVQAMSQEQIETLTKQAKELNNNSTNGD